MPRNALYCLEKKVMMHWLMYDRHGKRCWREIMAKNSGYLWLLNLEEYLWVWISWSHMHCAWGSRSEISMKTGEFLTWSLVWSGFHPERCNLTCLILGDLERYVSVCWNAQYINMDLLIVIPMGMFSFINVVYTQIQFFIYSYTYSIVIHLWWTWMRNEHWLHVMRRCYVALQLCSYIRIKLAFESREMKVYLSITWLEV